MKNLFDISGKTAVVTGGSSGIGAMIAEGFVKNGVKTYITARKVDPLMAKAKALSEHGTCIAIPSDLSSVEGIEGLVSAISEREAHIDILVNNAGANWVEPIDTFPEKGWDMVMDINIKSIFFVTQKCLPLLKANATEHDPARVINIASINGMANPGMPSYAYSASKSGAIHLTQHLASDLSRDNILVNGIAPGLFPSNMTAGMMEDDRMMKFARARTPRPRFGEPQDMAGTAIFLCSPASAWICGHVITLDGGWVAAS